MSDNTPTSFTHIGVVGAGVMGSGIALAGLYAGLRVTLVDVFPTALEKAVAYVDRFLARKDMQDRRANLVLAQSLDALADVEVVIEAAPENLDLKTTTFRQLAGICQTGTVFASNTSTLAITAIAAGVPQPERVVGMHFFNPAPVLPLVEVARGAQTGDAAVKAVVALAEQMDKTPVVCRDTPGFIVNRVARPFYGEALRLVGEGTATPTLVDTAATLGAGFRMGPFQLMDLIGIDINFKAMESMYEQTWHEPRYQPHPLQRSKVQQNTLGRKTGAGFYRYDDDAPHSLPTPPVATRQTGIVCLGPGTFAPGIENLLQDAGYTLSDDGTPVVGIVTAGLDEGLIDAAIAMDAALPPDVPLLCQAADCTITDLAGYLHHHDRLVGFDGLFFASGQVATLLPAPMLRPDIRQAIDAFVTGLGRLPVWVPDSPALLLPRIVAMLANEAAFAVNEGVAPHDTIDLAMRLGVNYPHGPLEWAQSLGLRQIVAVLDHLYGEYGETRYRCNVLLRRWARLLDLPPLDNPSPETSA